MGRFMEAMVVCKKGVKAHPSIADPRVLLARVYAEQGKDKKAIEELQGALQVSPSDKNALRMIGSLQIKAGEPNVGKENLLKAFAADPADNDTIEAMNKNGVPVPKPAAPEPPPPPPVAPPTHAGAVATSGVQGTQVPPTPANGSGAAEPPMLTPTAAPPIVSSPSQAPAQPRGRGAPAPRPPPQSGNRGQQNKRRYEPEDSAEMSQSSEYSISGVSEISDVRGSSRKGKKGSSGSRAAFFVLVFLVPMAAAGYFVKGRLRANAVREANIANSDATKLLKADNFKGYEEAIKRAEFALGLDGSDETNRYARGILAYAYTVRWGEHIHDDSNRENAEKHLKTGLANKEASAYLHAAEALFAYYNGKPEEGLAAIQARIAAAEADKKNVSIYYLTRGVLQTNGGDLEGAKDSLDHAQALAPDDPRVYVALGNLNRRRGNDMQALSAFNQALKYTRNSHPDGLLGTALLILDQDNPGPGYCTAARYVKTLSEMNDTAAPRQLALNSFVKTLMVSRVSRDIPQYTDKNFQKQLTECTVTELKVSPDDAAAVKKVITEGESEGTQLDRSNPEQFLVRGRRLFYEGKLDDAAAEIKKAVDMSPHAAQYHSEWSKVLSKKEGGEAQAEEALKKALTLVPNSPKLLSMLGQAQYKQKKFDAARDTLEKAISDPKVKNPEARFLLGKIYKDEKKDFPKAIDHLKRAAEEYFADPTMASVSYDELAGAYELKGEKDSAGTSYEKSLNADKDNATPYCHYARFLLKDPKEKDKAKLIGGAFMKMMPKDPCAEELGRAGITPTADK
ncbi:MAG: tetratricopeptide repeat protein [Archangium sp.]|nr:tetratricopeptide repeat protein [Archangium sp.]